VNRRKPKVVIPTQINQLIATGERVADAIATGQSIVGGMLSSEVSQLRRACIAAKGITNNRVAMHEASQQARELRDDANGEIYDVLAQVRDYANATRILGSDSGAGELGFEVVESNGSVSVRIPRNPDEFVALAERVVALSESSSDETIVGLRSRLVTLVEFSKRQQNAAISQREATQLLVRNRTESAMQITDSLRRIRDVGFGVAGPYNYESLTTMGFVVQSTATQNNGTVEPSEQNWSESQSFNIGIDGAAVELETNRNWQPGDELPEGITELEDVYRYTNTMPSEFAPFWTYGPHHNLYGQIPVTASTVLEAFEASKETTFFLANETGEDFLLAGLFLNERTLETYRLRCVLERVILENRPRGVVRNLTQSIVSEFADRLALSQPSFYNQDCPQVCETTDGVVIPSNNEWQPGDVIPESISTDSQVACFTHTVVGEGPIEYQRTHVQWPRKGVTKALLWQYYLEAFESACGSIAATDVNGEELQTDDARIVNVDCVTDNFSQENEVLYRSILYLQEQINATNQVTGDVANRLFYADVDGFIQRLDDNFVLNVLCVGVVQSPPTEVEVLTNISLSGCVYQSGVNAQDQPLYDIDLQCISQQFGDGSPEFELAEQNARDGSGWPVDGYPEGFGGAPLVIGTGPDNSGIIPVESVSTTQLVSALRNLGNENVNAESLGFGESGFVTQVYFDSLDSSVRFVSVPATQEELQNAFDALRNVPEPGETVVVSVALLGRAAVIQGLGEDGRIFTDSLGLAGLGEVYERTFIAFGGTREVWDEAVKSHRIVTVEQLIDVNPAYSQTLQVDLELELLAEVSREDILPALDEGLELAWYHLSGAEIPDNAFSTVNVAEFIEVYDHLDSAGEFDATDSVTRYQLFDLDNNDGAEDPIEVERVFYSLEFDPDPSTNVNLLGALAQASGETALSVGDYIHTLGFTTNQLVSEQDWLDAGGSQSVWNLGQAAR